MKTYIGIDPGPVESAYVIIEPSPVKSEIAVIEKGKIPNGVLIGRCNIWAGLNIRREAEYRCGIEMIASYGMPVGEDVFETCVIIGQLYENLKPVITRRIKRNEIKNHICHSSRANDSNIRQALIDRYGAPGTKKNPGITYGFAGDMWAALAVAVTTMETEV
jgi:hypothetical protein